MVCGSIKRAVVLACLGISVCASVAAAATRSELDGAIDFTVTMKRVAAAAEGKGSLPADKYFILVGTVTEVVPVSKDGGEFTVRVKLLSGEWIGNSEVRGYTCYVTFSGGRFSGLFPARASEGSSTDVVVVNTRVLVVARWAGTTLSPTGEKTASLEGVEVRAIQ